MKALIQGIDTLFRATPANTFYTAVAGQLYLGEAPQDASGSYGVCNVVSDVPDYLFGGERFEEFLVQFNLFSESRSAVTCATLYEHLKALLDDCQDTLTVSGFTVHLFEREFARLLRDPDVNAWQYSVQYRVKLEN